MGGKTDTAGTFQTDFLRGKSFLPVLGHLPAQGHLVPLTQTAVVVIGHVTAHVNPPVMDGSDIPVLVHINVIVTGKHHDSHFRYYMEECLVLMLYDDIVGKTAVMPQPLIHITLEFRLHIGYPFRQFIRLCLCPASDQAIRYIAVAPIRHLVPVIPYTEQGYGIMVKSRKKEVRKYLGYFNTQRQALIIAVYELIQEPEQFRVLYLRPYTVFHEIMPYVLEEMVGIKLYIIICTLIVLHVLPEQINKIMGTATLDT